MAISSLRSLAASLESPRLLGNLPGEIVDRCRQGLDFVGDDDLTLIDLGGHDLIA